MKRPGGVETVAGADLAPVTTHALECARRAGADHAEACLESSRGFSVRVRSGAVESLKQSGTRGIGLRVVVGGAVGFVTSTDLAPAALDDLARRAVTLAHFSTPDPANAFPAPGDFYDPRAGEASEDLGLCDPALAELPAERKIAMALALERLTPAHDPRIRRTDAVGVSSRDGATLIANSHGLLRAWDETVLSLFSVALADDRDGKQQSGAYGLSRRSLAALPRSRRWPRRPVGGRWRASAPARSPPRGCRWSCTPTSPRRGSPRCTGRSAARRCSGSPRG
ncbi:MAG: PmbA/TldA family metallopeptidase [Candidatus Eiseniibacteriota bacterium]